MFSNSTIIFNHDSKWYTEGEKEYVSMNGVVGNRICNTNYMDNITNTTCIELFEKIKNKNLAEFIDTEIPYENGKKETCIFMNIDLEKSDLNITSIQNPLFFLTNQHFVKYLKVNNLIKTDTFSIGSNKVTMIGEHFDFCVVDKSMLKLNKVLSREADMIKHIDIILKNYSSKSKKYNINAWIEYKSHKICDFGTIEIQKKIRLTPLDNKIINSIVAFDGLYLVIQIPYSNFSDWNNIDMSLGLIYVDCDTRRKLAQLFEYNNIKII